MIVLKDLGYIAVNDVMKAYGYVDITPDVGLFTSKRFEKDGKVYQFLGWHELRKTNRNLHWRDIEIEEVNSVNE